jgi:hypothetical protein
MIIVYDTSSAESRDFHNRRSATCGMFGATSASRWHCGYENSALSGLSGNKYDNH